MLKPGFVIQRKTVQILGFILAAAMALSADGQEHKPINVGTGHGPPFSDGMLAGNALYIAGQGGDEESLQSVPSGIGVETEVARHARTRSPKIATADGPTIVLLNSGRIHGAQPRLLDVFCRLPMSVIVRVVLP